MHQNFSARGQRLLDEGNAGREVLQQIHICQVIDRDDKACGIWRLVSILIEIVEDALQIVLR